MNKKLGTKRGYKFFIPILEPALCDAAIKLLIPEYLCSTKSTQKKLT